LRRLAPGTSTCSERACWDVGGRGDNGRIDSPSHSASPPDPQSDPRPDPPPDPLPDPPAATQDQPKGRLVRLTEWIVPADNPSGTIYGLVAIAALLAAESGRHETYLETEASALIAAGTFWLLHAYARLLGHRLTTEEHLSARSLAGALASDRALLRGAAIPLAALVLASIFGTSQATAVTVALWTAVGAIIAFELAAGIRVHASAGELALETGVGIVLGVAVLSLKIVLH
jgi:hypothetical protein